MSLYSLQTTKWNLSRNEQLSENWVICRALLSGFLRHLENVILLIRTHVAFWKEFLHFGPGMSYRLSWYFKTSAITTFIYELWSYICPKTIRSWEIWPKPFFGLLHQIFQAKFLYFGPGRSHRLFRCIKISTVSTFVYKLWSNLCFQTIRSRDIGGKSNFVHTHLSYFWNKFCISAQESPTDYSYTPIIPKTKKDLVV